MKSRLPRIDGLDVILAPVEYSQRTSPVVVETAKTFPPTVPKYASPPATTGEDSMSSCVESVQYRAPSESRRAVSVPFVEACRRRGPSIAGDEGARPGMLRRQRTRP